jgi:hypothetical protein
MSGLSLNYWRELLGFHPWHTFQFSNSLIPITSECNGLVYESAYVAADRAGRREIRTAIERAEQLVFQHASFWPSPRFSSVTIGPERYGRYGSDGRWLSVTLPEGEIRALGAETETGANTVNVTYSDADSDDLYETATVTATVPSGTLASEVVCRFLAADCGPVAPPEIEPRSVSVSGTTATIVFDTWTLTRPVRYASPIQQSLDPGNGAAPGVTVVAQQIEVLRRRADPTGTTTDTAMALLTWETSPWPSWACCPSGGASYDPAATATAIARAVIRDAAAGIVAFGEASYNPSIAQWDAACNWSQCRPPDRITIRYQAGIPREGTRMREDWAVVVARLAAAELARPICACTSANKELDEWQTDLSRTGVGQMDLFQAPQDFDNPLGSRRGQVYAWRSIQRSQRVLGVYAG